MKKIVFLILFLGNIIIAFSQSLSMKLWPEGAPDAKKSVGYEEFITPDFVISKVTDPTLTIYFPEKEKSNHAAIVICPGGGYGILASNHEGRQIGEYFSKAGYTCIVLKYRLPSDSIMINKTIAPLQDAQEAIRVVRRHAAEWYINPDKIGIMGFSAGGHLAATASTLYADNVYPVSDNVSARPDFSMLIYPVISMKLGLTHQGSRDNLLGFNPDSALVKHYSNELQVTAQTPPAFLVHSADDDVVPVENSVLYFEAMKKAGVKVELHLYQSGGHGYGLGRESTQNSWPQSLLLWLKKNGF